MSAHFYANLHHIYNHSKIIESLTCKTLIGDPNINNVMLVMLELHTDKGLSIYYVSSYNMAVSVVMLTNTYLREQGFIQKLMKIHIK